MANCNGVRACAICGRQVGCSCQLHYNAKTGQCVCCHCDPDPTYCRTNINNVSADVQSLLDQIKAPSITITSATARITHDNS